MSACRVRGASHARALVGTDLMAHASAKPLASRDSPAATRAITTSARLAALARQRLLLSLQLPRELQWARAGKAGPGHSATGGPRALCGRVMRDRLGACSARPQSAVRTSAECIGSVPCHCVRLKPVGVRVQCHYFCLKRVQRECTVALFPSNLSAASMHHAHVSVGRVKRSVCSAGRPRAPGHVSVPMSGRNPPLSAPGIASEAAPSMIRA